MTFKPEEYKSQVKQLDKDEELYILLEPVQNVKEVNVD